MESPFANDMFSLFAQAFKNLYPNKHFECMWVTEFEKDEDGARPLGKTYFYTEDDAYIEILVTLNVCDAVEIFIHELAHVAVGSKENHGKKWRKAFDRIVEEYNGLEGYTSDSSVSVMDGKGYVRDDEYEQE